MEYSENMLNDEFQIVNKFINVCTRCHKILNVLPVYCIEDNQMIEYICGRCKYTITNKIKCRQYAFENIAKHLKFSCSNKEFGCNVILQSKDVHCHESVCEYQRTDCPLFHKTLFPYGQCNWMGSIKEVDEHIRANHKAHILTPPQFKLKDFKMNDIFFTNVGSQLITVVIKYHKDSKYFALLMINGTDEENQCYRYQLELFDENKETSIILRRARLEPLSSMLVNITDNSNMLEIDIQKLKGMLNGTQNIIAKFGIVKKNKRKIIQTTCVQNPEMLNGTVNCKIKLYPSDEIMLSDFKCPACKDLMVPPIYICQAGHSICNVCKRQDKRCPNCQRMFYHARNFTLEKLTTKVHYHCRNREMGCAFVTKSEMIKSHERRCEFSHLQCLLNCGWTGLRSGMFNHILHRHSCDLLKLNSEQFYSLEDKRTQFNVVYAFGELFRFSIHPGGRKSPYRFNVQHLGMAEGNPKFSYQLQIIKEGRAHTLNLSLTSDCQYLTENRNSVDETTINIPWVMLKPLLSESTRCFYYKLIIRTKTIN